MPMAPTPSNASIAFRSCHLRKCSFMSTCTFGRIVAGLLTGCGLDFLAGKLSGSRVDGAMLQLIGVLSASILFPVTVQPGWLVIYIRLPRNLQVSFRAVKIGVPKKEENVDHEAATGQGRLESKALPKTALGKSTPSGGLDVFILRVFTGLVSKNASRSTY
eukprot:6490464-Amphidinium_carterae.1